MSLKRKASEYITSIDSTAVPSFIPSAKDFTHVWFMEDRHFQYFLRYEETEKSRFKDNEGNEWCLELIPIFDDDCLCDKVAINLELVSHRLQNATAIFSVTIYDHSGEIENFVNDTPHDFIKESMFCDKFYLDPCCISADFIILCKINLVDTTIKMPVREYAVCSDLGQLFVSGKHSDVTLSVTDHEFKVHKAILSTRSEVFAAMFEHEMLENKLNRVAIIDMKPDVAQEMLYFIYTGRSPYIKEMTADLLAAANKYALMELKNMCSAELVQSTNVETAADMLVLADRYDIDQLNAHAINFINLNAADVMETEGWKNLLYTHPHLIPTKRLRRRKVSCN